MCKVSILFVVHPGQAKQRREAKCWGKAQRKENEAPCFSVRLFISRRGGRDGRARRGEAGDNTHARTQHTHNTQRQGQQAALAPSCQQGGAGGRRGGTARDTAGGRATLPHTRTHAHTHRAARTHAPTGRPKISAPKQETATPACTRTTYRQTIHARTRTRTRPMAVKKTRRGAKGEEKRAGRH